MGQERVLSFIESEYDSVLEEIRIDISVFSLSNFVLFAFALALLVFKGRASLHLVPVSFALTVATVMASLFYIFGQDWLQTVIFNSYWGWGYLCFSFVIALALMDVAVNRARLTTLAMNAFFSAIGSAFSLLPC